MRKKESLWQLLKRLDEEAGQFNAYLHEANRYFDTAASETKNILVRHEKRLHATIGKVHKVIKALGQKRSTKTRNGKK